MVALAAGGLAALRCGIEAIRSVAGLDPRDAGTHDEKLHQS